MKMSVSIDKCKRCMKKKPTVVVWSATNLFLAMKTHLNLLCDDCYKIKKEEGTLYG